MDEKLIARLAKTYEEIAHHLDPETKDHFESVPADRRDFFKRAMFEDSKVPGAMNQYAYKTMNVAQRPGAHVKLDLNDLKHLNDKFGHEAGDAAITGFGGAALEASRKNGGQLFRTGGDEFDAHFPTQEQAYQFLRHASTGVGQLVPTGGHHKLSFSAGIGPTPGHADKALYLSKGAKTARFGDLRSDPNAVTGHGQHFAHSLMPGAAGPVSVADEPAIPEQYSKPKPTGPITMPSV
jgi:diguanylate cyclase (GGDEF)-like protein